MSQAKSVKYLVDQNYVPEVIAQAGHPLYPEKFTNVRPRESNLLHYYSEEESIERKISSDISMALLKKFRWRSSTGKLLRGANDRRQKASPDAALYPSAAVDHVLRPGEALQNGGNGRGGTATATTPTTAIMTATANAVLTFRGTHRRTATEHLVLPGPDIGKTRESQSPSTKPNRDRSNRSVFAAKTLKSRNT